MQKKKNNLCKSIIAAYESQSTRLVKPFCFGGVNL